MKHYLHGALEGSACLDKVWVLVKMFFRIPTENMRSSGMRKGLGIRAYVRLID